MDSYVNSPSGDSNDQAHQKAEWILHESQCLKVFIRLPTNDKISLDVPLKEEFKAKVVMVDSTKCRIYVTPLNALALYHDKLKSILISITRSDQKLLDKPTEITQRFVYLIHSGEFFRGVLINCHSSDSYMMLNIDSGMMLNVAREDVFELPDDLFTIPPLVVCMAVPPTAVQSDSRDCICPNSVVVCKIDTGTLILCVQDAYPPVLVCEVRVDSGLDNDIEFDTNDDENASSDSTRKHGPRRTLSTEFATPKPQNSSFLNMNSVVINSAIQSVFATYHVTLPYRLMACVCDNLFENFYSMRDTTLLTTIQQCMNHPSNNLTVDEMNRPRGSVGCIARLSRLAKCDAQRANRYRLYRGVIMGLDQAKKLCSVYLVDYGQTVECDIDSVFDMNDQSSELCRLPCASFVVHIKGFSNSSRRGRTKTFPLSDEEEYNVELSTQDDDGCYSGSILIKAHKSSSRNRRRSESSKKERCSERLNSVRIFTRSSSTMRVTSPSQRTSTTLNNDYAGNNDIDNNDKEQLSNEERKESMRRSEEIITEMTKSLRNERELFEVVKNNREHDLAIMTMQLQIANISRKLDMIANCSVPFSSTSGVGGYQSLGMPFQTIIDENSNDNDNSNNLCMAPYQQLSSYNTSNCLVNQTNELMNAMQHLMLAQNGGGIPANAYPPIASQPYPNDLLSPPINTTTLFSHRQQDDPLYSRSSMLRNGIMQDGCDASVNASLHEECANRQNIPLSGDMSDKKWNKSQFDSVIDCSASTNLSSAPSSSTIGGYFNQNHQMKASPMTFDAFPTYESRTQNYLCKHRTFTSRTRSQSNYGEPPKYLLNEYEPNQPKKNANDDGIVKKSYQRSPNKRCGMRQEFNLYQYQGRPSCTVCQGEGHFANNCPTIVEALAVENKLVGGNCSVVQNARETEKLLGDSEGVRKEVLYVICPRDKDGNQLQTLSSNEHFEDEVHEKSSGNDCNTNELMKAPFQTADCNSSLSGSHSSRALINSLEKNRDMNAVAEDNHFMKYVQYVNHVKVEEGREYIVKRCDDDRDNLNWPLFFVHLVSNQQIDFIEEYFEACNDSFDALPDDQLVVGTLCGSYCAAYEAVFRAVITNVVEKSDQIEVQYIDYGSYETVTRKQLKLLNDQSSSIRAVDAMAIPCMLSSQQEHGSAEVVSKEDECNIDRSFNQALVSCDLDQFSIRFISKTPNGINIVEVMHEQSNASSLG